MKGMRLIARVIEKINNFTNEFCWKLVSDSDLIEQIIHFINHVLK